MRHLAKPAKFCLASFALLSAGGPNGPGWIQTDIEADLPESLKDVGAYADLRDLEPREELVPYTPNYPLWSSGTDKQRLLFLPEGESIDADDDRWDFPVGTVVVKTFSLASNAPEPGPLETRLLFLRKGGWDYAVYVWDEKGRDATLLEGNWIEEPLAVEDAVGKLNYTVPARLDCRGCHETAQEQSGTAVLGITDFQVSDKLAGSDVFVDAPEIAPVNGRSPEETSAFGYFVGNCIHCHDNGDGENSSFSLRPEDAVASTVDQPFEAGSGVRIAPGDPDESGLYIVVVDGGDEAEDNMPPLGIDRRDPEAESILRAWIEGL
jgi:hypothetical protein